MKKEIKLIRQCSLKMPLAVATIGNFDGLHLGHYHIIEKVVKKSEELALVPTVITFEPLPQCYLRPQIPILRLLSLRQKLAILAEWGIKQVICLRFNHHLSRLSPRAFIEEYLVKRVRLRHLYVGEDFRFGHLRSGNFQTLSQSAEKCGFQVEPIQTLQIQGMKISSTFIRAALLDGNFDIAKALLGRNYCVSSRVLKGDNQGKALGFATANLRSPKVAPRGVFVTKVLIGKKQYFGITNSGSKPTFGGINNRIETHILDFSQDLYGKRINVEFLHKLRDEKQFDNIAELKRQISEDADLARNYLSERNLKIGII